MSIDPGSSGPSAAGVLRGRLRSAAIDSQVARDKAAKVLAAAAAVDAGVGGFGSLAFINDVLAAVVADGEACLLGEFSRWADCAGDGELFGELTGMLWDRLSAAPGDEWSGRGNDLRRAYRDGQLAACKRLRTELRLVGVETGR